MPAPKAVNKGGGGQATLFSFFNKPKVATITTNNNNIVNPINNSTPTSVIYDNSQSVNNNKKSTLLIDSSNNELVNNTPIVSTLSNKSNHFNKITNEIVTPSCSQNAQETIIQSKSTSSNKSQRKIIDDDDEDEFDENIDYGQMNSKFIATRVNSSRSAKNSKRLRIESDSEGENDSADSEIDLSSGDDDDDDDDLDDDDDSEDETIKKKRKKRLQQSKNSKPPLAPASKKMALNSSTPSSQKSTSKNISPMVNSFNSLSKLYPSTPQSSSSTTSSPSLIELNLPEGVHALGDHEHDYWDWYLPQNRKDGNGRKMDHPEYNPRTITLPEKVKKDATPAMSQWWEFKSKNMDTVLFFKVGKFYELFHMDADVGMSQIDLIYMKGTKAHSGFPEISYGKYSSLLVSKGYRVARVEQTETPDQLAKRNEKQGGKKEKVVSRECCSVMSKGTRTYCHLDDLSLLDENINGQSASVLMCIKEIISSNTDEDNNIIETPEYGICCIDTIIGTVTLAQFQDDTQRSRLRTMISRYSPSEVLLEANQNHPMTVGTVRLISPKAIFELLRGGEMPDSETSIKQIKNSKYFQTNFNDNSMSVDSYDNYPPVLKAVMEVDDSSTSLVLSALGGAIWQLKRSLIDYEVISLGKFYGYAPPDDVGSSEDANQSTELFRALISINDNNNEFNSYQDNNNHEMSQSTRLGSDSNIYNNDNSSVHINEPSSMTLDAIALSNLEVLVNNFDHTERGSLWAFINRCKTPFGKRLLRDWLCHPLFKPQDINRRGDAIEELLTTYNSEADTIRNILKNTPDLERLLTRVHSNGLKNKGPIEHPDARAVMYEGDKYNLRKIRDFSDILSGFENLLKISQVFKGKDIKASILLKKCVKSTEEGGRFPMVEMDKLLKHYRIIFDEKQAKKDGIIKPRPGVDPIYDSAVADVAKIETEFQEYLREMKRLTGINDINYWGTNKDRYQLEVPNNSCNKVPQDWTTKSQKKTHRRYWTKRIENLLSELILAEIRVVDAQNDTLRRIFEKFDTNRNIWSDAVGCVALLDSLLSLASVSSAPGYTWPVISRRSSDMNEGQAKINIKGGRHPMLEFSLSQRGDGDYIPNTTVLGGTIKHSNHSEYTPKLLLLSGPNMGGKSTLLRQTCLIAILAQIGCKVPADSCHMTPVDRIFTRVGASDKILAGQSTFFVELSETATMLRAATPDSLGILDELGRGTATFDGTAIAHAVVEYLVKRVGCRCLFATHYHSLVDDWNMDPRVKLGHMDCIVEGGDEANNIDTNMRNDNEEVTFLYRLCDGSSPRSYGINVARLAKLPDIVIQLAMKQSKEFEERMKSDSGCKSSHRNIVSAFFERLVSVVDGYRNVTQKEFTYITHQLWLRYSTQNISI